MSNTKIFLMVLIVGAFITLYVASAKAQTPGMPPGYSMKTKNVLCASIAQVRKELENTEIKIGFGNLTTKNGNVIVSELWLNADGRLIVTETPDQTTMCIISISEDFTAIEEEPETMEP